MARFDITMLNAPELVRALEALPDNLERKVLQRAMRDSASFLLPLARARAPKRTGATAHTLFVRAMPRRKGRVGYLLLTGTRADLGIPADAPYYYPAAAEFGTRRQPPRPWLRPTLQGAREALLAVMRQSVDAGIEREMRKAGQ